ncbi:MAG: immunity 63 family protein [Eubacterium sp.]|nr:immunity 63 family protein [Eubacterium sp.]
MLSTGELEMVIKKRIKEKLPNSNLDSIMFCVGHDNSIEGTYIFSDENAYHFVFTEKGRICEHKILNSVDDVLWYVLDNIIFDISLEYAKKNHIDGMDFRRPLFEKEIELFSIFGKEFKKRKLDEICSVLENNPYCDINTVV